MNEKRLKRPDLFISSKGVSPSELYWDMEKFSKRDLLELLTALDDVRAIVDSFGNPVPFIRFVDAVGKFLNTPIDYAYKERTAIQNRTKNTTPFLDVLKNAIGD